MHRLVPQFILQRGAAGAKNGRFFGSALFVDISGFTAVTESLMAHGRSGAETLAEVMAHIFTPLIEAVYERDGFVTGFAGDGFTAVFPGETAAQGVATGWEMQQALQKAGQQTTPLGHFRFSAKVGVAVGEIVWGIVTAATGQQSYYFRGEAIVACAGAEQAASGGDVVLTAVARAAVGNGITAVSLPNGYWRLTGLRKAVVPPAVKPKQATGEWKTAVSFQPTSLLTTSVRGEFRQVVSLFINVAGDPDRATLTQLLHQLFPLLTQYGGYLCRLDFGDKGCNLLLFWGAPTSHENDVARALSFALDLAAQAAVPLRMGITYRLVYAGFAGSPRREEYTCYGLSVNLAARLMMAAPWGEIWLDEATAQRAAMFEVSLATRQRFKGFRTAQPVFRLEGRRELVSTFYTGRLVGRVRELAWLETAVLPLLAGQFGGLVLVVGEAGVGKSRLLHGLQQSEVGAAAQWFLCQTDEILRQPLNPFRYFLRSYFGQSLTATELANKEQFEGKLRALMAATTDEALVNELARTRSFLGSLVDLYWPGSLYERLEPQLRQENQLRALKTVLRAESLRQPLVVHVEDAHWLDETSRQFLPQLGHNMAGYPLLLLLSSREPLALEMEAEPQLLTLAPLGETAVSELAGSYLRGGVAPALLAMLQARAEGNPFFVEQIVLFLREQGLLRETAVGYDVVGEEGALPANVQAILIARLDRLAQTVREVVQTAAVLGREFEIRVLSQMLRDVEGVPDKVQTAVNEAVWQALDELRYLFRHALLRDAAYQMQLRARLQRLHRAAAQALETLYANNLTPHLGELGYHYEQAGEVARAIPYWLQAGELAQRDYQNEQALAYYQRLLSYADRLLPMQQIEVRHNMGLVQMVVGDVAAAEASFLAAQAMAATQVPTLALWAQRGAIWVSLGKLYQEKGAYGEAQALLQTAVSTIAPHQLHEVLGGLYREMGNAIEGLGEYARATSWYERSLAAYDQINHLWGVSHARLNLGLMAWNQGDYERAEQLYGQALAGFEKVGDLQSLGKVVNNLGSVAWARRDMQTAVSHFEHALTIYRQCGGLLGQAIILGNLGSLHFYLEDYALAESLHLQSRQMSVELNDLYGVALCDKNLSDVALAYGRREEARQRLRAGLSLALAIQADGLLLDVLATTADFLRPTAPQMAWYLLLVIRTHPASFDDLRARTNLVEAALTPLETAVWQKLNDQAPQQQLADLVAHLLANELA